MPMDAPESSTENQDIQRLCDLVTGIASRLVDHPSRVSVEHETSEGVTLMTLAVPQEDLDKVLGKQGRTARSLRTLVTAAGARLPQRFSLDIVEG